jgi:hypothetical protein
MNVLLLNPLPSYDESIKAIPDFLYADHFYNLSVMSVPRKVGNIETSIQSPIVPLLASILSLKNITTSYLSCNKQHCKTRDVGKLSLFDKNTPPIDNLQCLGAS